MVLKGSWDYLVLAVLKGRGEENERGEMRKKGIVEEKGCKNVLVLFLVLLDISNLLRKRLQCALVVSVCALEVYFREFRISTSSFCFPFYSVFFLRISYCWKQSNEEDDSFA